MKHLRSIPAFTCLLFLVSNLSSQGFEELHTTDRVKIGDPCPQFMLSSAQEKPVNSSHLKGHVMLINFFATWCGPSVRGLTELEKSIREKYRNRKDFILRVIGRGHGVQTVQAFKAKKGLSFPMYAHCVKVVYNAFAETYIPINFIIDKKGEIAYSGINYTEEEFEQILIKPDELLN